MAGAHLKGFELPKVHKRRSFRHGILPDKVMDIPLARR